MAYAYANREVSFGGSGWIVKHGFGMCEKWQNRKHRRKKGKERERSDQPYPFFRHHSFALM